MLYSEFFNRKHSKELERIISENNITLFDDQNATVLLYMFPLIERLVVEILDLSSIVNIESKEQGTIKTVNSLIQQEITKEILGNQLIEKITKYFKEDGIRNKMMHFDPDNNEIKCHFSDIQEVKQIAIELIDLYESKLEESKSIVLEKIEPIIF